MYAAAVDSVVATELILQEASLSRLQIVCFLVSCTLPLIYFLYQFMLEQYGHGQAGGWTAPNEAVSPRQAFVSDTDFQIGRLLNEQSDKAKPVSRRGQIGQIGRLAWWTWRTPHDASSSSNSQIDSSRAAIGARTSRFEVANKQAQEATWKAGSQCSECSEGMDDMDVQGVREFMEELPQVLPFQSLHHERSFAMAQAPGEPQVLPLPAGWTSPDLPHVLPFQTRRGLERPEQAPGHVPPMPPMPFQKKQRDASLGHLLPFQKWRDLQELKRTALEPSAWPPFGRDKYPQDQSHGAQDVVQPAATNWDAQLLPGLSLDAPTNFVQDFAQDAMRHEDAPNAPTAPKTALRGSLRLAALLPVPSVLPSALCPPPELPPPLPPPLPVPPPPAHVASIGDDNIRPCLMRHLRESLSESSIPSELSQSNPLMIASMGSFGHPDMCYRPCVYLGKGSCRRDIFCTHCHFDHEKTYKLGKNQKRFIAKELDEVSVLAELLPCIQAKATERGLQQEVSNLCSVIQRRVDFLSSHLSLRSVPAELTRSLKRLSLHTLTGILIRRSDFEPEFMDDLTIAVAQFRAAVPTSLRSIHEGTPDDAGEYDASAIDPRGYLSDPR